MSRYGFMVGALAGLLAASPLLGAARNTPPPVRVTIPVEGFTDEVTQAVQTRLARLTTAQDVTVNATQIELTVRPGQTLCLAAIGTAVEEGRGDAEDAHLTRAEITLSGSVAVTVRDLSAEQSDAVRQALTQVRGVGRVTSSQAGRFAVEVASARGVRVADLDEAIAGAVTREGDPFRVTDVCWTAPEANAEQPGHS